MIHLTRFNGSKIYLNAIHIELVEGTPDTVITLTTGKKYLVKESVEEIIAQMKRFYQESYLAKTIGQPSKSSE
ncbi:flagellar FlbD family protein [Brevibacillus daliensis]|uniref:flagellar FlbD family protein n=1 Tax=Brevibacillus daliensis TaxID=2892995 RepID=UPI001E5C04B9|nr:flagellar FlbD family protein [Brevibacillus daliensis]